MKRIFYTTALFGFLAAILFTAAYTPLPIVFAQTSSTGGAIVVDDTTQASAAEQVFTRVGTSWPWYTTRASGLIAALALILLMLSGVGFITGRTYSFLEPITAWATHRALGIIFGIAVIVHVVALYFDHFVPFGIADLLVPFSSSYREIMIGGASLSLYVALGIVALYLCIAIVLTSLFWIEKRPKSWHVIHLLSYIMAAFVFFHALFLGTDLASGVLRFVWIAVGVLILSAGLFRLWRAKTV